MKKYILASAAAAALSLALPAVAAAQTGFIDVSYVDAGANAEGVVLGGSVLVPAGSLNLQLDGNLGEIEDTKFGGVAAHLFHRNESWAFGGVIGVSDAEEADEVFTFGLEAAKYFQSVTLQAGVTLVDDDSNDEPVVLDLGARFFATDNFSLGASYAYVDTDFGEEDVFGVDVEYKFNNNPISLIGGYSFEDDSDSDAWSIGVRYNFGHDTLKDRDRNGPSMGR